MRISAGKWKRTPLPVIDLDGLRPTGNRIRETVFDWLTFLLGGYSGKRALDMFAGSGALGLEFASRGGTSVLIERDPQNARNLSDVCAKLKAGDDAVVRRGDSSRSPAAIPIVPLTWCLLILRLLPGCIRARYGSRLHSGGRRSHLSGKPV
ncbi:MAG: RsmD family RNA methyltransferase [Dakarella massiliensis]